MAKQYNQQFYRPKTNKKGIYTALWILVLLGCMYVGVYHSHRYLGFESNAWLGVTSLIALVGLHTVLFEDKQGNKYKFAFFILIVGVPLLVFVILMHIAYRKQQLEGGKVNVSGVVTELFTRRQKRSSTDYALFFYEVDNKSFRQIVENKDNRIFIGDTIRISCATADPEIFELISD